MSDRERTILRALLMVIVLMIAAVLITAYIARIRPSQQAARLEAEHRVTEIMREVEQTRQARD